jgi:ATP-dependent DNA ligase
VSRMAFFAFDLLFERAVDLRGLPLSERQRDLARLCDKARKHVPYLYLVESFPEGEPLLEWCASYGLEGIVSKKLSSPYSSGACRAWVKVKCDGWRQANQFRHKMFEGSKKPDPSPQERDPKEKAWGTGACAGAPAGS